MPLVRRRRYAKKKAMPRRRRQQGGRRVVRQRGTSQVFSETQKVSTECAGVNAQGEVQMPAGTNGVGVKLITQLNVLSQAADYGKLWSAYKILKAKFTIIPKWTGEQQNEAAIGTGAALGIIETPRFAYAVNDFDQNLTAPLTELNVLQDNGCKVRMFTKPVVIHVKPKPLLEQQQTGSLALVNTYTKSNPWIEFDGSGTTVPHVGIDGYFSAQNSLTAGFASLADVQCTISFICKDPR